MSASHFRELEVWQLAMSRAKLVHGVTAGFPREERYGLASQLQRSAVSIPSNIAEGNALSGIRDYARFVSVAQGSRAQLQTQLLLARDLSLGDGSAIDECRSVRDRVGQMLPRLHQALSRKLETESRVPNPESRSY